MALLVESQFSLKDDEVMPYRQYTQCVQAQDFTGAPIARAAVVGLFAGLIEVLVFLSTGAAPIVGYAIFTAAALFAVVGLLSFVHWWLYGRLICLGGDRCAIGMVVSLEPPESSTGFFDKFDNDYSANLLLAPHVIGESQENIETDGFQGELIRDQRQLFDQYPGTSGLPFTGEIARSCETAPETAVLHFEFEGAGMYELYQWLKALLVVLIFASIASWFCFVPVIGWIACLIAAALTAIALAGFLTRLFLIPSTDRGSPSDVNPELGGTLQTNGCDGVGADLLVVSGEWVYDSLHSGWNEIHPVRHCQKIGTWTGIWPFDAPAARNRWCDAITDAHSPTTVGNQTKPENHWRIHPDVDGCEPESVPVG
jgi:hypothetical protein